MFGYEKKLLPLLFRWNVLTLKETEKVKIFAKKTNNVSLQYEKLLKKTKSIKT